LGQCVAGDEVGDVDDGDGHVFVEAVAVDEPRPAACSFALDRVIEGAALDQPQRGAQVADASLRPPLASPRTRNRRNRSMSMSRSTTS
jgi:hypothetical protein